jgi:hypothetical protein
MPQQGARLLGQGLPRPPGEHAVLGHLEDLGRCLRRLATQFEHLVVRSARGARPLALHVHIQVVDRPIQVGAEAMLRAAPPLDRSQGAQHRLTDQIVGVVRTGEMARITLRGVVVALPEHRVVGLVAALDGADQFAVTPQIARMPDRHAAAPSPT